MANDDLFSTDPTPAAPAVEVNPDALQAASDRFKEAVGVDYMVRGSDGTSRSAKDHAAFDKYSDEEKQLFAEQIDVSARAFEARLDLEAVTTGRSLEDLKQDKEAMAALRKEFGGKLGEVINSAEDGKLSVGEEFKSENAKLKQYAEELEKQVEAAKGNNRNTTAPELGDENSGRDTKAPEVTPAVVAGAATDDEKKGTSALPEDLNLFTNTHNITRIKGEVVVYERDADGHQGRQILSFNKEETQGIIKDLTAIREGNAKKEDTNALQIETLKKLGLDNSEEGKAAFAAMAEVSSTLRDTFNIPDPKNKEQFEARINELQESLKPQVQAPAQTIDPLAPAAGIVGIAVTTPEEGVAPSPKPKAPEGIAVATPEEGVAPSPKPKAPQSVAVTTPEEGVAPSPKPKAPEGIAVATPDEGKAPAPNAREQDNIGQGLAAGAAGLGILGFGLPSAALGTINGIRESFKNGFDVAKASDVDLGNVNAGISNDAPQRPPGTIEEAAKNAVNAGVNGQATDADKTTPVQSNITMDTKSIERARSQIGGVA